MLRRPLREDGNVPRGPLTPAAPLPSVSDVALFRFAIVSEVRVRTLRGQTLASAVRDIADRQHVGADGGPCRVGARSIYRWSAAFSREGLAGLAPTPRSPAPSHVLDPALVAFLATEKRADGRASIPELLRRAVVAGLLTSARAVDRTTVWRAFRRLGLRTRAGRAPPPDARRFAKEHRMQIVLCDGKHFRAGPRAARRVAIFFIDDASRYVPHVVVGPSESSTLFLRGLHGLLERVGRPDIVYDDHGSAFIADDSHEVLGNFDIGFVHGTAGYPQGRGKIERFNRTAEAEILRDLAREDVDPDCLALELRLDHWLREDYNRQPHGSLRGLTPEARFLTDERPLRPCLDPEELRRGFFTKVERVVSNDHVISVDSVHWEVPRGLAGHRVTVVRDVFDPRHLRLAHDGASIRLHPVDLHANARARRGATVPPPEPGPPVASAANRAADRALAPITQPDGGFSATCHGEEPTWK